MRIRICDRNGISIKEFESEDKRWSTHSIVIIGETKFHYSGYVSSRVSDGFTGLIIIYTEMVPDPEPTFMFESLEDVR